MVKTKKIDKDTDSGKIVSNSTTEQILNFLSSENTSIVIGSDNLIPS